MLKTPFNTLLISLENHLKIFMIITPIIATYAMVYVSNNVFVINAQAYSQYQLKLKTLIGKPLEHTPKLGSRS